MGRLEDAARYHVLRHPTAERYAHRIELMIRSSAQRRAIARVGKQGVVKMGRSEVPLDLTVLREYLMYRSLARGGFDYEPGSTRQILEALRPDDVFIDVGANIGYFTIIALGQLGPGGAVFAYEPNDDTYRRLVRKVTPHDPLHVARLIHAAASDVEGVATLYHSPVDDARDSLTPVSARGSEVRTVRLDGLGLAGRSVIAKIDAEGAEEKVLGGMEGLCEGAASLSILIEWNPPWAGASLWRTISDRFQVYSIDERSPGRLIRVHSMDAIRTRLTNLWLVRPRDEGSSDREALTGRPGPR
jgi:FkbM family methyltransferase